MERAKSNEKSVKARKEDCRTMAEEIIELLQQAASIKQNLSHHQQNIKPHETANRTVMPVDSYAKQLQNDFGDIVLGSNWMNQESVVTRRQSEENIRNNKTSVSVVSQSHPCLSPQISPPSIVEVAKKPKKHKHRSKDVESTPRSLYTSFLGRCRAELAVILHCIEYVMTWSIGMIFMIIASPWKISLCILGSVPRLLKSKQAVEHTNKIPNVPNADFDAQETPVLDELKSKSILCIKEKATCGKKNNDDNYRPSPNNLKDIGTSPVCGRQTNNSRMVSKDGQTPRKKFSPSLGMLDEVETEDHSYNHFPRTSIHRNSSRCRQPSNTTMSSACCSGVRHPDRFVENEDHHRKLEHRLQESLVEKQCQTNSNRGPSLRSSLITGSNDDHYGSVSQFKSNSRRYGSKHPSNEDYDQYSECRSLNVMHNERELLKNSNRQYPMCDADEYIALDCQYTDYDTQAVEDSPRMHTGSAQSMSPMALSINLRKRRYKQSRDSVVSQSSIVSSSDEDGFDSQFYPRSLKSRSGNFRYHNERVAEQDLHLSQISCRRRQQCFVSKSSRLHREDGETHDPSNYQRKDYGTGFLNCELQCISQTTLASGATLKCLEEASPMDSEIEEAIERKRQKKEILLIPFSPEHLQACNQMSMINMNDLIQSHSPNSISMIAELKPTQLRAQERFTQSSVNCDFQLQAVQESPTRVRASNPHIKGMIPTEKRSEFHLTDLDIITDARLEFTGCKVNRLHTERESIEDQDKLRYRAEMEVLNTRGLIKSDRSFLETDADNLQTDVSTDLSTFRNTAMVACSVMDAEKLNTRKSQTESEYTKPTERFMESTNVNGRDVFGDQADKHPVKIGLARKQTELEQSAVNVCKAEVRQDETDVPHLEQSHREEMNKLDNLQGTYSMGIKEETKLCHDGDQKDSEVSLRHMHPSLIHIAEKLHQQQKVMAHQSQLLIQQQAELIHQQRMQIFPPKALATRTTSTEAIEEISDADHKQGVQSSCTSILGNSTHPPESSEGFESTDVTKPPVSQMTIDTVDPSNELEVPSDTPVRDQGMQPKTEDPKQPKRAATEEQMRLNKKIQLSTLQADQLENNGSRLQLLQQSKSSTVQAAKQSSPRDLQATQSQTVQTKKEEEARKPVDAKAKWLEIKRKFYGENYGKPREPEKLEAMDNGEPCFSKPPAHKIFQYNMRVGRARQMGTEPPEFEKVCRENTAKPGSRGSSSALGLAMMAMINPRTNSQLPPPLQPTSVVSYNPSESDGSNQRKQHPPVPKPRKERESRKRIRDSDLTHSNGSDAHLITQPIICSVLTPNAKNCRQSYSTSPPNRSHDQQKHTPSRPQEQLIKLSDEEEEKANDQGDVMTGWESEEGKRGNDPWDWIMEGRKQHSVSKILQHPAADHTGVNLRDQSARVQSAANFYCSQNMKLPKRPEGSGPVVAPGHTLLCSKQTFPMHNSPSSYDYYEVADNVK